jgi:RNAse (barnase) inhibitor barstar
MLMTNIDYWRYSLENPEPEDLEEEPYIHDEYIVDNPNYLKQVNYLRDLITTYCTLSRFIEREPSCTHEELGVPAATADEPSENPRDIYQWVLNQIDRLLITVENIQHTEFVAYFKCVGISHSDYRQEKNMQQRLTRLREILQRYCKNRKERYDQLGYTHVIQQALYDSVVSRKQGTAGIQKIRQIIEQVERESQVEIQEAATVDKLTQLEYGFYPIISPEAFEQLREKFRITYKFGQEKQAKIPDLVIKIKDRLLILEAKHIKESGGTQNNQIDELIKFISQEEEELISQKEEELISYVAFLDGRYFNKFRDTSSADKARKQRKYKVRRQREAIEKALQDHPNNYFVNTAGLRKLLADLLSETTGNVNSQTSRQ